MLFWDFSHPINRIRYQIKNDCIEFSRIYRHFGFRVWQGASHMVYFYLASMKDQAISDLIF